MPKQQPPRIHYRDMAGRIPCKRGGKLTGSRLRDRVTYKACLQLMAQKEKA